MDCFLLVLPSFSVSITTPMFNFIHLSQTLYKPKNPPAVNKELNVITGTDKMVEE